MPRSAATVLAKGLAKIRLAGPLGAVGAGGGRVDGGGVGVVCGGGEGGD